MFFLFGYEGEDDQNKPPVDDNEKKFSQSDVNRFNKKANDEKAAAEAKNKELSETIQQLRNQSNMTAEEKQKLEQKLMDMEQEGMSAAQKAEQAFKKLEKDLGGQIKELTEKNTNLMRTLHTRQIHGEITDAAMEGEHKAVSPKQIIRMLESQAFVDEEGNAVIKDFEYEEDGKPVKGDLSIADTLSKMRGMAEYGNLFIDPTKKGSTMHNQSPSVKEKDPFEGSMEDYMERRKKRNK